MNGEDKGGDNPLVLAMDAHKTVRAKFSRTGGAVTVSDEAGLRNVLNWQTDGVAITFGADISLSSVLPQITKNITINGNGHALTRTFAGGSGTHLLYIAAATVSVSRLHFKDGRASSNGGAIRNNGTLTLESCVFSGNQASGGCAIYTDRSLTVKGCTFYNNTGSNGVIYAVGVTVSKTGNLFYGNTGDAAGTDGNYNVTVAGTLPPVGPVSFRPLSGGAALSQLPSPLPDGYPAKDFYGENILAGGASGAAQTAATGYYLDYGVAFGAGEVTVTSGTPNGDGLYTGSVQLTAVPESGWNVSWTVNGVDGGSDNPLTLTMDAHKTVRATFSPGSATTVSDEAGLRSALGLEGNIIAFGADITLTAVLPDIAKSITIEGNGHTLTQTYAYTTYGSFFNIGAGATVSVRRLHFKDGSSLYGGAIYNLGDLSLESCIFSGNTADRYGGAVRTNSKLTVKGCTFHNNRTMDTSGRYGIGGAIYVATAGTVSLTGNLFYGNTASNASPRHVVYATSGVTSGGYNVSDKASGTNATEGSGYAFVTGDITATDVDLDTTTFKPTAGTGIKTLTGLPDTPADFPTTYFDGTPRTAPATAGAMPEAGSN